MGFNFSGNEVFLSWEARPARLLLVLGVGDWAPVVAGDWRGAERGV